MFHYQDSISTHHRKELMNMQKLSAFARIEARDISPAAPPSTPGNETKKSRRPPTTRNSAKSGLPTPTTPQKTPDSSNRKIDDNNKKVQSRDVTPEVSFENLSQHSCLVISLVLSFTLCVR